MEYLYPNFQNSIEDFESSRTYWNFLISPVLAKTGDRWEEWLQIHEKSGEYCGDPIISYVCPARRRSIRIIQRIPGTPWAPPEEELTNSLELSFWIYYAFGDGPDDPESIECLTVTCILSEDSAQAALEKIDLWASKRATFSMMKKELEKEGYRQ